MAGDDITGLNLIGIVTGAATEYITVVGVAVGGRRCTIRDSPTISIRHICQGIVRIVGIGVIPAGTFGEICRISCGPLSLGISLRHGLSTYDLGLSLTATNLAAINLNEGVFTHTAVLTAAIDRGHNHRRRDYMIERVGCAAFISIRISVLNDDFGCPNIGVEVRIGVIIWILHLTTTGTEDKAYVNRTIRIT